MSLWKRNGDRTVFARLSAAADSVDTRRNAGEYQLLYKYLRDRYANRVVLTFAEIEDVLGFSLPEDARLQQAWWGGTETIPCRSWTLASRTATANLLAQSVVFERQTSPDLRPRSN